MQTDREGSDCRHSNLDNNCVLNHFLDGEWIPCKEVCKDNCSFAQVPIKKEWRSFSRGRQQSKFKRNTIKSAKVNRASF